MFEYFDRYSKFRTNYGTTPIPNVTLAPMKTDKKIVYRKGKTRFDKLSDEYYGNPWHGFLILLANQQFGGLEFDIPDGQVIRIPFPFKAAVEAYSQEVDKHINLYGK